MRRTGSRSSDTALIIIFIVFCFGVAVTEQAMIPSISSIVAAVAETKNNLTMPKSPEKSMYPRPVGHAPGSSNNPAALGWARPLPSTGSLIPPPPGGVDYNIGGGGWAIPSTTTTTPSPHQGWGPPPPSQAPPPSTTSTTPEPEATTSTTTTTTPTPSTKPTPGWLRCPEKDLEYPSYFPHESSCPYFYQCSHGKPFRLRCRPGLHFNPYYSVCDWPDLARCPYENKEGLIEDEN